MNIEWSPWYRMDDEKAKANVPDKPGTYQIRTDFGFGRLSGKSRIISIGRAIPSLRNRLSGGRFGNLVKNLDRPEKWLLNANKSLEFRYIVTDLKEEAQWLEALGQWEYENKHWELPPGNDRLEKAAIFRRIEQQFGKFDNKKLTSSLEQYQTTDRVAAVLGVPRVIVDNLLVYWGLGGSLLPHN